MHRVDIEPINDPVIFPVQFDADHSKALLSDGGLRLHDGRALQLVRQPSGAYGLRYLSPVRPPEV